MRRYDYEFSGEFIILMTLVIGACSPYLLVLHFSSLLSADRFEQALLGDAARRGIRQRYGEYSLPPSAKNVYFFDGGNFNGSIEYVAFDCATLEECWQSLETLSDRDRSQFAAWRPSSYAVVMRGPGFYSPDWSTPHWRLNALQNGASYESVDGAHRLKFYAIDFDRRRVYCHFESGGFPQDRMPLRSPRGRGP